MSGKSMLCYICILALTVCLLSGCGDQGPVIGDLIGGDKGGIGENHTDERRTTLTEFLLPEASGAAVYESGGACLDASNTQNGYVMVRYTGSVDKAKLQITDPAGVVYAYNLAIGEFEAFPLSGGSGTYRVDILEHVQDDMYALILSQQTQVTLADEFGPFLYPNQFVWFTPQTKALNEGIRLSQNSSNDLDYVEQVYSFVTGSITYDKELAENIYSTYLPDIDRTLELKTGICFDYASLMAALLRSQGIPTKLVVGYAGTAYHAWISVYLDEIGWVDGIIRFDGESWSLMDPTLAAGQDRRDVEKYIGDGSNYVEKFFY